MKGERRALQPARGTDTVYPRRTPAIQRVVGEAVDAVRGLRKALYVRYALGGRVSGSESSKEGLRCE
jgi:hypothetical protein